MKKIFFNPIKWEISRFLVLLLLVAWSTAQSAERIKPDDVGRWLVDGFEIQMDIKCNISRSDFWPEKYCNQPYVVIEEAYNRQDEKFSGNSYFTLVAGNIELGDKWMFDRNYDPQRWVPLSEIRIGSVQSEELFKFLVSGEDDSPPIRFMTRVGEGTPIKSRSIILSGFKSYADNEIAAINYRYSQEESDARRDLVFALIVLAVLCVIAVVLARFLLKKFRSNIQNAKRHIETKRVSRVAEDEAIRVVVRNSVQNVDDESLKILRNQIKSALEAGDTKTAEELLRIIKRLEDSK